MSKKTRAAVSAVLLLMTILVFSRCDYSTKVVSSAEPPDSVFNSFITSLKEQNFDKADSFLANGATIRPQNDTGYAFFDDYVEVSLDLLKYELLSEPEFNGMNASLNVKLVSIDSSAFLSWTSHNLSRIEHDYMVQKEIKEFDKEDKKAVDKVMSMALKEYSEKDAGVVRTVSVSFVFSDRSWRIAADEDLIKAIFGGNDNEGKDNAGKKESDGNDKSGDKEKP